MITIKNKNIVVGEKLTCIKSMGVFLTEGQDYEIAEITKDSIKFLDNDMDPEATMVMSMDKNISPNVFRYFQIW